MFPLKFVAAGRLAQRSQRVLASASLQSSLSNRFFASKFTAPNVNLNPDKHTEKNVIYSKHSDCFLHDMTVAQRFFERSSLWSNKIAIECGVTGRKYTYDMLRILSRRFGSSLRRMGFQKGDFMGLILPNIPEFPIALFGSSGIGMPVTLLSPMFSVDEMAKQIHNCNAKAIVGLSMMAEDLKKIAAMCPSVQKIIVIGDRCEGFADLKELLQDPGDLFDDNLEINPYEDTFIQPYSSGTMGMPKGVVLSHFSLTTNGQQILHPGTTRIHEASGNYQEVMIAVLPFFHVYGMVAFMVMCFENGTKVVSMPRFQADTYLNALKTHNPTHLYMVPPLVSFLANHPGLKVEWLSNLHTFTSGAASLNKAVAQKALDRLKQYDVILQEGFGMSEGLLTHLGPVSGAKLGSCGELLSRIKCKVVDVNTGEALGPYQTGELWTNGPQQMKGYFNNPEATRDAIDPAGWIRTGDIAYYDDDQHFFIVDRIKELIKVKGFQVSPSELEDILCRHPGIFDAAVMGVPDDYDGEIPRAFIVKSPHYKGDLREEEIVKFVESQVAPHKQLKGGVVFIDSIPKSNTGKILRREMKAKYL